MSPLNDQQVDQIARRVVQHLAANNPQVTSWPPVARGEAHRAPSGRPTALAVGEAPQQPCGMVGVFAELDSAVNAATRAFQELDRLPLSVREHIIASMRESMLANAESLAREAHEETGLGRYEDKTVKNRLVASKTPGTEDLVPVANSGDHGLTLMERAPFGVIGSITPCTNPTSTIICNAIGMIAAGNAVVFNVHPAAKQVSIHNVALLNEAILRAGGPANLVTTLADPTVESAQALMKHPGIRLLVVTGGPGVVEAAMQSGKRAICAGPGNPPVVVDETADLALAGRQIVRGASFDNNVICTDEKEVFVVGSVADDLLRAMSRNGALILNRSQAKQIEKVIFKEIHGPRQSGMVDRGLIGKNATVILSKIGLHVGDEVRLAVIDVDANHPLVWTEQLMPVLPVVRVSNADEAIDLAVAAEGGRRHTAATS